MAHTPEHAARVLGLMTAPTLEDVKRARRDMALKYHPDRCKDAALATRHMARINAAADVLIAHLKQKRSTSKPDHRPDHTPFRAEAKTADAETRTDETHRRSADCSAEARKPERPGNAYKQSRNVTVDSLTEAARRSWNIERALARSAVRSYRATLTRIGPRKTKDRLDLHILKFDSDI